MIPAGDEPAAIIAIRPSLCGGSSRFVEKRLEHFATRLGYTVLATIDTDVIPNLTMPLAKWRLDAVIVLNEAHIALDDVTRWCEVLTLEPEAMYSADRYERLRPAAPATPDHPAVKNDCAR